MIQNKFSFLLASAAIACLSLNACSSNDPQNAPLEGERISILDLQKELSPTTKKEGVEVQIKIPAAIQNADWPQASGYPHHAMENISVGNDAPLTRIWQTDIGSGSTSRVPLNAKPIIVAEQVFTLDSNNRLRTFNTQTGQELWEQNVQSEKEDKAVIAGGLAYADGVLFVTSGYNEVLALNPQNGNIYWRSEISAGSRAAPTIMNGRVFVTTMNNNAVALDAASGKILWEYEGVAETTGLLGAASPAANQQVVIPAFSNGDIMALRVENGSTVWEDSLANSLRLGGMAGLSDVRGNPVITKDRVIAVSYGNKMIAFDKDNGTRLWQREVSSGETPWVSGNAVYVLTSESKLISIDINNGDVIWISALPKYKKPESGKGLINWSGPIMINNKLLLSGTAGRMLEIDPMNGQEVHRWDVKDDVSLSPVAAGGTLYVLTDDGTLNAYR